MTSHDQLVYGEHIDALVPALCAVFETASVEADGAAVCSVTLEPALAQPLWRALMRVEAELLLEDAHAIGTDAWEERTAEQRAADALVRLANRVLVEPGRAPASP